MEDRKIVSLYWQRSEAAISETEAKYGGLCYSIALGVLHNREDSEECVNDTYVRAWNSIPPAEPDNLGAYVSKITRRLAIDKYRRATADKRSVSTVSIYDELSFVLPGETGEGAIESIAVKDALNRFLMSLPPNNRIIFMRRYWYMDSVRDIARTLHMTEPGVKLRLARMRKKLKSALAGEGVEV